MKKAYFILAAILTGAATLFKAARNDLGRYEGEIGRTVVSRSLREAERDGVLVMPLAVPSGEILIGSSRVTIQEAWIEKYSVHRYPFVWFHRRVSVGGFIIAMKVTPLTNVHFYRDFARASFTQQVGPTRIVYTDFSEDMPSLPLVLSARSGLDSSPVVLERRPHKAPEPSAAAVTSRAPTSTSPASRGRDSS